MSESRPGTSCSSRTTLPRTRTRSGSRRPLAETTEPCPSSVTTGGSIRLADASFSCQALPAAQPVVVQPITNTLFGPFQRTLAWFSFWPWAPGAAEEAAQTMVPVLPGEEGEEEAGASKDCSL